MELSILCGTMSNLEVHHQQFRSRSADDTAHNPITLCAKCHFAMPAYATVKVILVQRPGHYCRATVSLDTARAAVPEVCVSPELRKFGRNPEIIAGGL